MILIAAGLTLNVIAFAQAKKVAPGKVWTPQMANQWYEKQPWLIGADYIPASAINQLEMWQADTFDPGTIDKELGWAEGIGMNTMRVFLHSLAYKADPAGKELNMFQVANSDVISYHCYDNPELHLRTIEMLKFYGKPLVCTEYMARPRNSTFINTLPILKKQNVAAINWGFVDGKTNTKYAWSTPMPDGAEPAIWFHEIFKADGTPYKKEETDLIKELTKAKQ